MVWLEVPSWQLDQQGYPFLLTCLEFECIHGACPVLGPPPPCPCVAGWIRVCPKDIEGKPIPI